MSALLDVRRLDVSFGGVRAVDGVDLAVEAGTIVGLIGPNGAGKTTLIDAVTGFVRPTGGTISLDGLDLRRRPPYRRARLGLARSWQSLELFADLSVRENVAVTADAGRWWSFARDAVRARPAPVPRAVDEALEAVGLDAHRDRPPDELSLGQRKLLGVARALAQSPRLVCMDEPAAGLDTSESVAFGSSLRSLLEQGISILLVDHDMGLVLSVCDVVYVLDDGAILASGTPRDVRADQRVIAAYLGDAEPGRPTS
jgi:branched-chain amino acid transport system ATP-binding protein